MVTKTLEATASIMFHIETIAGVYTLELFRRLAKNIELFQIGSEKIEILKRALVYRVRP